MWPILAQSDSGSGGFQQKIDALARTPLSQIVIFVAICTVVRLLLFKYLANTEKRIGPYKFGKFVNEAMDAIIYAGVFVFMLIRPFAIQAFLIPTGSMLQTLHINDFIVANKAIYRYTEPQIGDIVVFKPPERALNDGQGDVDFIKRCVGTPGHLVEVRDGKLWRDGKAVDEPYLTDSPRIGGMPDEASNGHPTQVGANTAMNLDWKLVHYLGKARSDLYDKYISVQILVSGGVKYYNYAPPGTHTMICHEYAVACDDPNTRDSAAQSFKSIADFSQQDRDFEHELEIAPPATVPKGFVLCMGDNRNNSYDGRAWGLTPREDVIGRSEFIWLPISRWQRTH